jgi:hypothetical protein
VGAAPMFMHCIGASESSASQNFDCVPSVDRLNLALTNRRPSQLRKEKYMPFKDVTSYNLGYNVARKEFHIDYTLARDNSVTQIFLSSQDFLAVADMFRNATGVQFNTDVGYFVSDAKQIGG